MSFFLNSERKSFKYFSFAAMLLLLSLSEQVNGQSGRRGSRPEPNSTPTPSTIPTTDANSRPQLLGGLERKVKLLIGREPTSRKLQSEDGIFSSFVDRLNEYANVDGVSIGDVKRKNAVIRAKTEPEAFVVLLKFDIDSFQSGTIILNSPDLQVEYEVLAPRTGKKQTGGKIYFQSIGGGRLRKSGWPGGTPIKITAEATGIEAAEHVHDWLRLNEMRTLRPTR